MWTVLILLSIKSWFIYSSLIDGCLLNKINGPRKYPSQVSSGTELLKFSANFFLVVPSFFLKTSAIYSWKNTQTYNEDDYDDGRGGEVHVTKARESESIMGVA